MSIFFAKSEEKGKPQLRGKLIDFAHYSPLGEGKANSKDSMVDENIADGMRSLLRILEGFLKEWED